MITTKLVDVMNAIDWQPEAVGLINSLLKTSLHDQSGAAVVMAAALMFAREYPMDRRGSDKAIEQVGQEFSALIFEARKHFPKSNARPALCVVGGTDTLNQRT